jgi:hypothetical protein
MKANAMRVFSKESLIAKTITMSAMMVKIKTRLDNSRRGKIGACNTKVACNNGSSYQAFLVSPRRRSRAKLWFWQSFSHLHCRSLPQGHKIDNREVSIQERQVIFPVRRV